MLDALGKVSPNSFGGVSGAQGLAQPMATPNAVNPVQTETLSTDFGSVLGRMTLEAISTLKQGEATSVAGVRGAPDT